MPSTEATLIGTGGAHGLTRAEFTISKNDGVHLNIDTIIILECLIRN